MLRYKEEYYALKRLADHMTWVGHAQTTWVPSS